MKGRNTTADQKRFHDALCRTVGCIACAKDGFYNPVVSVHHIDGRTKPLAHWVVLPLCAGHHQDGYGMPGLIAVHPWKRRFEARYGRQLDLLAECWGLLRDAGFTGEMGETLVAPAYKIYLMS